MGNDRRPLRYAVPLAIALALVALPGAWNLQTPGSPLGPTIAWAGGTPDETLQPPPAPPPKKACAYIRVPSQGKSDLSRSTPASSIDARVARWTIFWTIARATWLRP